MSKTHYLPSEELRKANYPEVIQMEEQIEAIISFAMEVDSEIYKFNNREKDKIELDTVHLRKHVDLCRQVCEVLGNAPNVCYDILLEIRNFQFTFQELIFVKNRFGNEYIGEVSKEEDFGNGGIG